MAGRKLGQEKPDSVPCMTRVEIVRIPLPLSLWDSKSFPGASVVPYATTSVGLVGGPASVMTVITNVYISRLVMVNQISAQSVRSKGLTFVSWKMHYPPPMPRCPEQIIVSTS